MTSLEPLNTKLSANELSFLLVTHMVNSNPWFDSYVILRSGQGAEYFLDKLVTHANGQVSEHEKRETSWGVNTDSEGHFLIFRIPTHTHVFDSHSQGYGHIGMVTHGVSGLLEIGFTDGLKLLTQLQIVTGL
jgi:hypothetical protein